MSHDMAISCEWGGSPGVHWSSSSAIWSKRQPIPRRLQRWYGRARTPIGWNPAEPSFFVHALILGSGFFRDPIYEPFQSYLNNPDALREHSLRLLQQTDTGQ